MEKGKKVFVCGGGHQGLSMAAHLALNNIHVSLWNRTEENIRKVIETNQIYCDGIVNGVAYIDAVSSNIEEVISDFIMVTVPSNAHKDVARLLAPYVHNNMVIVLNPGRTFGAIEFATILRECGVKDLPHIAETQTIVYTCRRKEENKTTIFALKEKVAIAAIKGSDVDYIIQCMPDCLRNHFQVVDSVAITSLSNVGMVLHCAPVLMNIGWIESDKIDFKYYYDGISKSVAKFLEKLDMERMAVAEAFGVDIESTAEWIRKTYQICGRDLFECIRNNKAYKEIDAPPTIKTRYILEDIPNGLVAIEALGHELGVDVSNCSIIIDLASSIFDRNFRKEGRTFSRKILDDYC